MRKNTRQVIEAFRQGRPLHPASAIWTDGEAIWSYSTILYAQVPEIGFVLNSTRYSITTTIHQNALRAWMPVDREVSRLPRGARITQLQDAL